MTRSRTLPQALLCVALAGLLGACRHSGTEIPADIPIRSILGRTYAVTTLGGSTLPTSVPVLDAGACTPTAVARMHIVFGAGEPGPYQLRVWTSSDTLSSTPSTATGTFELPGGATVLLNGASASVRRDTLRGTLTSPLVCAPAATSFMAVRVSN